MDMQRTTVDESTRTPKHTTLTVNTQPKVVGRAENSSKMRENGQHSNLPFEHFENGQHFEHLPRTPITTRMQVQPQNISFAAAETHTTGTWCKSGLTSTPLRICTIACKGRYEYLPNTSWTHKYTTSMSP